MQTYLKYTLNPSPHTYSVVMDAIFTIAHELSNGSPTVEGAIQRIVDRKRDSCPRSLSQVQRRLYAAANWVWHEIHHLLPMPLSPPRKSISTPCMTLEQRVFTTEEIDRMKTIAPSVSVYADALVRILFTTGVRIAAVGRLSWSQLQIQEDGAVAATVITLLEKGARHHMVLLTEDTRHALEPGYILVDPHSSFELKFHWTGGNPPS